MTEDEKTTGSKSEVEDIVRRIWLAGLGAYGKSRDEAQSSYEKFSAQTNKMFDDLVKQGEDMEGDVKSKFKQTSDDVEARVNEVRRKFGFKGDKTEQKIAELSAKIDALTQAVAELAARQKGS